MRVIHKELLKNQGNHSTYLLEVMNNDAHAYNERFKIIITTDDSNVLINDIFCYNGTENRYDCVTNLISPDIFTDLI
jgi:hypothetical protein